MARRWRTGGAVLGIVVLIVACPLLGAPSSASGQEVTAEAKAALQERDRLQAQTQKLQAAGKLTEAIASAEAMLKIERKVLPAGHDDIIGSLDRLAELRIEREDLAAAREARQEALEILRKRYGETHWKVIDARLALEDAERLGGMTGEQRQKRAETERLNKQVVALFQAGRYGEALSSARRELALRKEVQGERHPDYASSLNNLAVLLERQGDYAAARPLHEKALAIRKEVLGERHPNYAGSLQNLALLLKSQGDYAAARPLYEKALAIYKEVQGERHPDFTVSLNDLALLLQAQGDYTAARPLLEKVLAIDKEVQGEQHPDYATSLNNLAVLLEKQGDCAAARPLHEKALAIRKEVQGERHPLYALSLNNLAALLKAQGDYAAARPLCEKALAIYKTAWGERHPDYASSLNNLAFLLHSQGDYAAARPLYEKAMAIRKEVLGERHPDYATSLSNLARLFWTQRDLARAVLLLEQALKITQGNLELAAAAQSERQQLAMARDLRSDLDAYLSVAPLAQVSPASAYRYVLAAKGTVFERQRRLRAQRRRLQPDPQSEAARRFAEYQQTTVRLATLALATPNPKQAQAWKDQVAELSQRKDELEAELARLDAGFRAERAEATRTPERLRAALPPGTALLDLLIYAAYQPPAQGKGEFQKERRLVAFVVRPDRPIARIDLGPLAPIVQSIDQWRPILISGKTAPAASDPARALRGLIWEPIEPHLDGIALVLVSPDGPIGLVPLAALPGKEPGHYLIEERAIAVVPVPRMLGSTATLPAPGQGTGPGQEEPAPSLLLVGDIEYGGDPGKGGLLAMTRSAAVGTRSESFADFPTLPATAAEVASIANYFRKSIRGAEPLRLDGARATEEALRREAPRHRFLHLATHGYFAPEELRSALGPEDGNRAKAGSDLLGGAGVAGYHPGLLSGLALAGANRRPTPVGQDDGILTALEVAELELSGVELAVLSACETGLGEVAGGEGLLGLQRAFQVAGAHSVVASLWKIGDQPTHALMARLYENLWGKGQSPLVALRQAQLSMLRGELDSGRGPGGRGVGGIKRDDAELPKSDRLPPFYWAAFVLSTDRP
jgi:CHAT domain-containing protein